MLQAESLSWPSFHRSDFRQYIHPLWVGLLPLCAPQPSHLARFVASFVGCERGGNLGKAPLKAVAFGCQDGIPYWLALVVVFGLCATWCDHGVNRPMLSEVVAPQHRARPHRWLQQVMATLYQCGYFVAEAIA